MLGWFVTIKFQSAIFILIQKKLLEKSVLIIIILNFRANENLTTFQQLWNDLSQPSRVQVPGVLDNLQLLWDGVQITGCYSDWLNQQQQQLAR